MTKYTLAKTGEYPGIYPSDIPQFSNLTTCMISLKTRENLVVVIEEGTNLFVHSKISTKRLRKVKSHPANGKLFVNIFLPACCKMC